MEQELVALRRRLHAIPELAFEEHRTREAVADALHEAGIPYDVHTRPAGGAGRGPGRARRAPRRRADGAASRHPGVVHVCGHDAPMAMVIGAGRLLQDAPPDGHVVLVFQPAEERGGGAREMVGLDAVRPVADALGEGRDVERAAALAVEDGASPQRRLVAEGRGPRAYSGVISTQPCPSLADSVRVPLSPVFSDPPPPPT